MPLGSTSVLTLLWMVINKHRANQVRTYQNKDKHRVPDPPGRPFRKHRLIEPDKPNPNAHIEPFKGRLRDDWWNRLCFCAHYRPRSPAVCDDGVVALLASRFVAAFGAVSLSRTAVWYSPASLRYELSA
jgi:hypothetical protein